ncbi:type I restriction endonuclease subunit R [Streptomyces sp. NPDC059517]|uniref:type I restriction endonuclease subunit R n=1 Tax=Streptomyces sp. NPDC059517 TaxID=3346855 RepID=UPI003698DB5E
MTHSNPFSNKGPKGPQYKVHHEEAFRIAIMNRLLAHSWEMGLNSDYRRDLALDTAQVFAFIGATQNKAWLNYADYYDNDPDTAQRAFAEHLAKWIDKRGTLQTLRQGVKAHGIHFDLAYFKPSQTIDPGALSSYSKNRLTVVRDLVYATRRAPDGATSKDEGNKPDLTLFVNGIPVATAELKNPLTGTGTAEAMHQYRTTRDHREPLFAKRALAHFAVDPDAVFLTTQLKGRDTVFLPFNTGSDGPGNRGGAGNPAIPDAARAGTYRTSYLWEQIWHPDTWLDLLERYVHQSTEKKDDGSTVKKLIFPRFHQWHAVRELTAHAARNGAGHNYLVMHSAGSGKSNTIAWLAHRLSDLHDASHESVFDKVLVITDRTVLDDQLQETIGDFQQTNGLVLGIGGKGGSKSSQLADALAQETAKILIVTLQTFPALLAYLRKSPVEIRGSRFAIIVDEAHSSQSGEAATDVKKALRDLGLDTDDEETGATEAEAEALEPTTDERLAASARARGQSANLSYFAFTATPKHKTLKLFGTKNPLTGLYEPFHTYSMRQAIEEKFILDPLCQYVRYETYWQMVNEDPHEADREVDKKKANALLALTAHSHTTTAVQRARVIAEHFMVHTRRRLGGRAKAMVVCRSRYGALQLYRQIVKYFDDNGYPDPGVLVAFSGSLKEGEEEVTEAKLNGFSEGELRKRFAYTAADDKKGTSAGRQREYRILVVADKYQTGFDQPLLTTMYVDKKLKGVAAVQTLSRLNRTHPLKDQQDLCVLDFANDPHVIQSEFRPFFEEAQTMPTDPNLVYDVQHQVMDPPILLIGEMQAFVADYLRAQDVAAGDDTRWEKLHAELYRHTDAARDRFIALRDSEVRAEHESAEQFRADLADYVRKYSFLAQIVPYIDIDLERLHLFGHYLLRRLPPREGGGVDIGETRLEAVRLERVGEVNVSLTPEGAVELRGFGSGAGGAAEPEKSPLAEVIDRFNERFGTDFTEEDFIVPLRAVMADEKVRRSASQDDEDGFKHVIDPVLDAEMMKHIDSVRELGDHYFHDDRDHRESIKRDLRRHAFRMLRRELGMDDAA